MRVWYLLLMKDFEGRIYAAAELPAGERIAALRRVIMSDQVVDAVNAVPNGDREDGMQRAITSIINSSKFTAPEIRTQQCWLPLMEALLTEAHRDAARGAMSESTAS